MARNQWEDALQSILQGAVSGYQTGLTSRQKITDVLMAKQLEKALSPEDVELKRAQAEYYKARSGVVSSGGTVLTPSLKRQKVIETGKLVSTTNRNALTKQYITDAVSNLDKIPAGQIGSINVNMLQRFDPNNPVLGDWQKVKSLLSDIQLGKLQFTKGAISDREMEFFAKAVANDDILNFPRIKFILDKAVNEMNVEEKSLKESYYINYGELPNISDVQSIFPQPQTSIGGKPPITGRGRITSTLPPSGNLPSRFATEASRVIPRTLMPFIKSPQQAGYETGLSLFGKKPTQETDITAPISPVASYQSIGVVSDYIQEYAKPILQGEPEGVINKVVAEIVTRPSTYLGLTNFNSLKNSIGGLLKELRQTTPKLMTEKWLVEKAGNLQKVGKGLNAIKNTIYDDVYKTVGDAPTTIKVWDLIKNSNAPKEVIKEIETLIGKNINTVGQAKQVFDIIKSKIPTAVSKGRTIGRGGLFQKGLRSQNLASSIKEVIYDSVGKIDKETATALKNLDSYMGKEVYPLLETIMSKVGRRGKPTTSGVVSTFSGTAGKASERLLFKQAPRVITETEQYLTSTAKKDLLDLAQKMEQVVKDWVKFQTRQGVKRVVNPAYWFRRGI